MGRRVGQEKDSDRGSGHFGESGLKEEKNDMQILFQ